MDSHLPGFRVQRQLDAEQLAAVHKLVAVAEQTDGAAALNEAALLHLRRGAAAWHALSSGAGSGLAGYALLDPTGADLELACLVAPEARGGGLGTELANAVLAEAADRVVLAWSHGDHPAARALADRLGFERTRQLLMLGRDLAQPVQVPQAPDGVVVRTFEPGTDDQDWLALNAAAFSSHPEQGSLDHADLAERMSASWFDPAGFFVAEESGAMIGFHWTKVHDEMDPPVGEVYVVGVSPDAQGRGLGGLLTAQGLAYLRERGLGRVLLYVEADNAAAVATYERLGFQRIGADVQYRRTRPRD